MFRCDITGKTSKPGEAMIRIVAETRTVTYNNGGKISQGEEIVQEIKASRSACRELGLEVPGVTV